jgi:hypothetical protein
MYRQWIGSLIYLVNTELDICFSINIMSQFVVAPTQIHCTAAKHVLLCFKGTFHYGMRYVGDGELLLHGYIDSNWAGDASARKITSMFCFSFGQV